MICYNLNKFNDIKSYLQRANYQWRDRIMRQYNGRCPITDKWRHVSVHHISRSFEDIMKETFAAAGIEYRPSTHQYSLDELDTLVTTMAALHRGVTGVVLSNKVHAAYHNIYGRECTTGNWREFKKLIKSKHKVA